MQLADHPDVLDPQFGQHRSRVQRSARPNLALRTWWKRRRAEAHESAPVGGGADSATASPSPSVATRWPSIDRSTRRCADHLDLDGARRDRARGERSNSMCGDTGVSSTARCRGETTGPRADSEYAVEPVGVATIRPSAAYEVNISPSMSTQQAHGVAGLAASRATPSFSAASGRRRRVADSSSGPQHHPSSTRRCSRRRRTARARRHAGRLDLGEVAEQPDVDADDRHRGAVEQLHGAQHRAVAAEADARPSADFGVRSVGERRRGRAHAASAMSRNGSMPARLEPTRRPRRRATPLGSLVVADDQHPGHAAAAVPSGVHKELPVAVTAGDRRVGRPASTSAPAATIASATSPSTRSWTAGSVITPCPGSTS